MQQIITRLKNAFRPLLVGFYSSTLQKSIKYFDFEKVVGTKESPQTLLEIFRLRFEVYCLERHFLDAHQFSEGLESDEYDNASIHFAAFAKESGIVGTVRLIQPQEGQLYPWEKHCRPFPEFEYPSRHTAAEISRLVVRKNYRRRCGDSKEGIPKEYADKEAVMHCAPTSTSLSNKRFNSPLLLLGMYREMYRYSRQNGIRYWYAAMERSLARSLGRMGFEFVPIGPQVDYYGPVTPHMVDIHELNQKLEKENKILAAWFNDKPISLWFCLATLLKSMIPRTFIPRKTSEM